MGSPMQFPTPPPQIGAGFMRDPGAGGGMPRPPSPQGSGGAVCPTCGMPSIGGQAGGNMPPPQGGGQDPMMQARQARRAAGGGFQGGAAGGRAGGNMPPSMPKPGGMPFKPPFQPGVTDMPGRPQADRNDGMFGGSFRNFGG